MKTNTHNYFHELNSKDTWLRWEDNLYNVIESLPNDVLDDQEYYYLSKIQSKYVKKANSIYEKIATLTSQDNYKKLVKLEKQLKKNEKIMLTKIKKLLTSKKERHESLRKERISIQEYYI